MAAFLLYGRELLEKIVEENLLCKLTPPFHPLVPPKRRKHLGICAVYPAMLKARETFCLKSSVTTYMILEGQPQSVKKSRSWQSKGKH